MEISELKASRRKDTGKGSRPKIEERRVCPGSSLWF